LGDLRQDLSAADAVAGTHVHDRQGALRGGGDRQHRFAADQDALTLDLGGDAAEHRPHQRHDEQRGQRGQGQPQSRWGHLHHQVELFR
jgi:hypothetical protein